MPYQHASAAAAASLAQEIERSLLTLQAMPHTISVLGSATMQPKSTHYTLAEELGTLIAQAGFAVLVGGYTGAMAAAYSAAKHNKGIAGTIFIDNAPPNLGRFDTTCSHPFVRTTVLLEQPFALVALPGGYGTCAEIIEWLLKTPSPNQPIAPLYLLDEKFWTPWVIWLKNTLLKHDYITQKQFSSIRIYNTPKEVMLQLNTLKPSNPQYNT